VHGIGGKNDTPEKCERENGFALWNAAAFQGKTRLSQTPVVLQHHTGQVQQKQTNTNQPSVPTTMESKPLIIAQLKSTEHKHFNNFEFCKFQKKTQKK